MTESNNETIKQRRAERKAERKALRSSRRSLRKNSRRRKKPVFSFILIACCVLVPAALFITGIREASQGAKATPTPLPEIQITATPTPSPTPGPTPTPQMPPPVEVRGVYYMAEYATNANFEACLEFIEATVLNAVVIDVKDDYGTFPFPTENELLKPASDAFELNVINDRLLLTADKVKEIKERGIYAIARIVCFKDDFGSGQNPGFAILNKSGGSWRDASNKRWLDPYNKEAWEYIAEACREAARLGFDEVQLDYVRFPTDRNINNIAYNADREFYSKTEIINEFVAYIREEMIKEGVRTSIDIFAIAGIGETDAEDIGQDVGMLLGSADSICPMVYPSHFAHDKSNGIGQQLNGILFTRPDTEPYGVIYNSLQHYIRHVEQFSEANPDTQPAVIRPYLQYFTARHLPDEYWIEYGAEEVLAQIQAVTDAGINEWLLWKTNNGFDVEFVPPVEN